MAHGDCRITLSQYDGDIGDKVRVTASFYDADGELADPTTVVIKARDPSDNEATITNSKSSTGVYVADQVIDESNRWWFRAVGTGAIEAAAEKPLLIRASAFDSP
jgi:hypothetical protein